ncbi:erythromycin esterase family protein [Paraburkholderia phymatum]|uniref:Erythromycin esterase family protein n=1 Tax=Paraburkholderia phymatum TaxID=148447 RepID=A0ACC6UB15_9BURK
MHPQLHERLRAPRLERFICVIYRPDTEMHSHYTKATLSEQFRLDTRDRPLATRATKRAPDLDPFGV